MEETVLTDLIGNGAQAKIRDLEIAILVEQEVLGLKVAVIDAAGVAESDGGNQLLEIFPGNFFLEATLGDLVEKLAAADELHDEVDLGLGGHDLEQLDDVGMPNTAENGDLALDVGDEPTLQDLLLVDDFDGHALAGLGVAGMVHLREGSVAQ